MYLITYSQLQEEKRWDYMGGRQRGNIISRSFAGLSINFYSIMVEGSLFIILQGLNLEAELKSCWCLMSLGHGRESLLVSKSKSRESQSAREKKKENRKKKKRFCLSDRAVQLSANAKEGKTLRRHVKPVIQLSVVVVGRKWRLTGERDLHGACVVQPFPPCAQSTGNVFCTFPY